MSGKVDQARAAVMRAPTPDVVVAHAEGVIRFMQLGYGVWMAIYIVLGILSVSLPGLVAMGLFETRTNQILAGAGALMAAISAFLKPHEYATGFDNAAQIAWKAQNSFELGTIDNVEVARQLARAIDLTTFHYGAISDALHKTSEKEE